MKRRFGILAVLLFVSLLFITSISAYANPVPKTPLSIVFTHDMHSNLESRSVLLGGKQAQAGGFARLAAAISQTKATDPDTLVLDAGDFSMGTLFQTIYSDSAPELRLMGLLGFDAATLGNHEFDYRIQGLTDMLKAAKASGDRLPQLLCANIDWAGTLKDSALSTKAQALKDAMDSIGAKPYAIVEKGGYRIALFGVIGEEAIDDAPMSGLKFQNYIDAAKSVVSQIKAKENPDIIICLSHSGTSDKPEDSEDVLLAKAVPDIDVIISGHSHTVLQSPMVIGSTTIVSSGANTDYLGHLLVSKNANGRYAVQSYSLIPLNGSVPEDAGVLAKVSSFKDRIDSAYLSRFGYKMGEVVASSPHDFTDAAKIGKVQGEEMLGNLIADSYVYAVSQVDNQKVDVAVVPAGVIRGSFTKGAIKTQDIFNVSSLGIGADGIPGYPLVSVYLTGSELWALCEVDASISDIMQDARLYMSGISYTFNQHRLFLNRVTEVYLVSSDGTKTPVNDDKLYRVVGGLYSTQMLGSVKSKSFGLLSIVPKDKNGNPISDFEKQILYKGNLEYKEWVALADYLHSFGKTNGVPTIPARYAVAEGRKVINSSTSIASLLEKPNKIFFMLVGIVLVLIVIVVLIISLIVRLIRRLTRKKPAIRVGA